MQGIAPPRRGTRDFRFAAFVRGLAGTVTCLVLSSCASGGAGESVTGGAATHHAPPTLTSAPSASSEDDLAGNTEVGADTSGSDEALSSTGPTAPPYDNSTPGPTAAPVLPTITADRGESVEVSRGLLVDLLGVDQVTVEAETPGEISGPAVAISVRVTNESDRELDLSSAVIDVVADDGEPGIGTTAGPAEHLGGVLAPGHVAEGTYVFMLDAAGRELTISVNHTAGAPIVIFTTTAR